MVCYMDELEFLAVQVLFRLYTEHKVWIMDGVKLY
jgi:hypothetical protein